ncbi:DUF2147 domain-containing protein [Aliiroseovarius subalbicans]|uniref:DUF2147 domain-containing protein n=1 Tax=Aliiroseovarius subalbicans TaxID=2925840 RepID=UPI001F55BE16|nr:DUF2147 domain-containing protein [Aliiroseovarius subalbicans]MCI2398927.1 DUF2147 domain-containing protein [Aliiroseovarius subalbicans]
MKKFAIALVALIGMAAPALADPVLGMWKTEVDDGKYAHVDVHMCGAKICGKIVKSFENGAEYQSPNQGKNIIRGMVAVGGGKYEGEVWRPSNDKIYIGKLQLNGSKLKMKGCVAGGLLCKSQSWSRL